MRDMGRTNERESREMSATMTACTVPQYVPRYADHRYRIREKATEDAPVEPLPNTFPPHSCGSRHMEGRRRGTCSSFCLCVPRSPRQSEGAMGQPSLLAPFVRRQRWNLSVPPTHHPAACSYLQLPFLYSSWGRSRRARPRPAARDSPHIGRL